MSECKCAVTSTPGFGGIAEPYVRHCPLHAAAEEMRTLLETHVHWKKWGRRTVCWWCEMPFISRQHKPECARTLLARIEQDTREDTVTTDYFEIVKNIAAQDALRIERDALAAKLARLQEAAAGALEQIEGIGIEDWHGAEGLDLTEFRAALEASVRPAPRTTGGNPSD